MKPLRPTPAGGRPRTRLNLEYLDDRAVPAYLSGAEVIVGTDAGAPPLVRIVAPGTEAEQTQFLAFESNFYGGVRVAVGDVNGDGYPDLAVAAGPSGGPAVKVYDGRNGAVMSSFMGFSSSFSGGVNIAVGDVTGDGKSEVIVGAGAGGGPAVGVFDGYTGNQILSFFAYSSNFLGGVRVAAGDTTGDGIAEIITTPGYGGGPDLRIWQLVNGRGNQIGGFGAFGDTFTGGSYVGAGDVDDDGLADIVVGAGPTGGPRVGVFTATGTQIASYFAYGGDFYGGVRVAAATLTDSGEASVMTVAGPTGAAQVNVYDMPNTFPESSFYAFSTDQTTGFFVAGSTQPLNIPSTPQDQIDSAYQALKDLVPSGSPLYPDAIFIPIAVGGYNPYYYNPFFYGFGLGLTTFGLGFGGLYYDAFGLYSPLNYYYSPGYFGTAVTYDPGIISAGYYDLGYYDSGYYYDPGFYDMGYYDPGYYDYGYYDPGYYDSGYVDPGYYYDYGGYDYGYYDYGGFSDFGGYSDFGGGFFF